jgi:hypothetical protein
MPEIDFSRQKKLSRGKYAERARRSLEVIALDKKMVASLGGPDAVRSILRALADAIEGGAPRAGKRRRKAA